MIITIEESVSDPPNLKSLCLKTEKNQQFVFVDMMYPPEKPI